jgi:hypothetical protein
MRWVALGCALWAFALVAPAGASAFTWSPPEPISGVASFDGITCQSASLCVAVDSTGDVVTSTDPTGGPSAWTVRNVDPHPLVGVSCPSATLCVAVDTVGDVVSSTNPTSSWNPPVNVDGSNAFAAVSCPSVSLCVAVDGGGGNLLWSTNPTSGAWNSIRVDSNEVLSVSCASASLCVADDQNGNVLTSTDPTSSWSPPVDADSTHELDGISCSSATLCAAVDQSGNVVTSTDPAGGAGVWSAANVDSNPLVGVSCPAGPLCVAVDYAGNVLSSMNPTGGMAAWSTPVPIDAANHLTSVSCASASLCVAVDGEGNVLTGQGPPVALSLPSISGNPEQGQTLTESHATWSGAPSSYAYQWEDCDGSGADCAPIAGATSQSYTLGGGDVGHTIRVQETAANSTGQGEPVVSAQTVTVIAVAQSSSAPYDITSPTISGTVRQGQTLREAHGSWANAPTSYSYRWQDCNRGGTACKAIRGATKQTYKLTSSDVGHTIRVQETATNRAGSGAPASSSATHAVTPAPPSASLRGATVKATTVRVAVACRGARGKSCAFSLTLSVVETLKAGKVIAISAAKRPPKPEHRTLVLAKLTATVAAGRSRSLSLPLDRSGKALLARRHTLRAELALLQSRRTVGHRVVVFSAKRR